MKKGDYPVMGVTKLTPEVVEKMATKKYKLPPNRLKPTDVSVTTI